MANKPVTVDAKGHNNLNINKIIYILYMVGILFGLTFLVGGIVAYIYRDNAVTEVEKSHIEFQISTFWKGIIFVIIGLILNIVAIGVLVFIFLIIWILIRNIKGLKAAYENQAITNVKTWWF